MVNRDLIIYGASDDLVEFDGAYVNEFNIYGPESFHIDLEGPSGVRSFTVEAEFGDQGWKLAFAFYNGDEPGDEGACDPEVCRFPGVQFVHTGKNNHPKIIVPVWDYETVNVYVGSDEEDDDE